MLSQFIEVLEPLLPNVTAERPTNVVRFSYGEKSLNSLLEQPNATLFVNVNSESRSSE